MTTKEKLDHKYSVADPAFIAEFGGWADTAFGYRGYSKIANFTWEWETVEAKRDVAFGRIAQFDIPKGAHLIGPTYILSQLSALTNGGGTSRFVDYVGFALCNLVEAVYSSNRVQTIDHRAMHMHHRLYKRRELQEAHDVCLAGNISKVNRTTLATGVQNIITPLPMYFTDHIQKFLINEALTHELSIRVHVPELVDIAQSTAGTPTGTLNSMQLRMLCVYFPDEERDAHVDKTLIGSGEVMAIKDYEWQLDNALAAGSTNYTIKLTELKSPVYDFRFVIRDEATATTANDDDYDPYDSEYYPTMSWSITSGLTTISRSKTGFENIYMHNPLYLTGPIGEPLYGYNPSLDPNDRINTFGHDNFSGFNNPTLNLTFASALGADKVVDIVTFTNNTVQTQKGDHMKNFI